MKSHQLAEKFPEMTESELKDLADKIKQQGQQEDIVTLDGEILDGRNRYQACKLAKVKPRTRTFGSRTEDGADPVEFVLAHNLSRRHLSDDQRATIAAEFAGMERGRPKEEEKHEGNGNGSTEPFKLSTEKAAKKMNVSIAAVKRAVRVKKHASSKVKSELKKGKISLTKAAEVAKLPKKKQEKALTQPRVKLSGPKAKMLKAVDDWWKENKGTMEQYPQCQPEGMIRHIKQLIEKTL